MRMSENYRDYESQFINNIEILTSTSQTIDSQTTDYSCNYDKCTSDGIEYIEASYDEHKFEPLEEEDNDENPPIFFDIKRLYI